MAIFWLLMKRVTRALWFLPAVFSLFAFVVLALALFSSQVLPDNVDDAHELPLQISSGAIREILTTVASSILAVSVFALSTLVTLLTTAAQTGSPRAVPLIVSDRGAQTSISVFVGAFLFSIVGIIGLSGDFYGNAGRFVLFMATILVVLAVAWALLRWIQEISVLGRVGETIARTEKATRYTLRRAGPSALYGCASRRSEPTDARAVHAENIGFVQHFDPETLQAVADEMNLCIHVVGRPGVYVDFQRVLAWVEGDINAAGIKRIHDCFLVGAERTFEYDPAYGFVVLADIARRALSPAINDPSTAIHVVTVQTRLIGEWASDVGEPSLETHDRVTLIPMAPDRLLTAAFEDIARDATGAVDVTLAVLRGLRSLASVSPESLAGPAATLAADILARAETAIAHPPDVARIRKSAVRVAQQPAN